MMKSIFLSDSKVLDVDVSPIHHHSSTKMNDNEYILVDVDAAASFDFDADTNCIANSDIHDEEEYDYCDDAMSEGMQYEPFSLTEEMILEEADQPSIQHILDEAHKSASELVIAQDMPDILESSASDVSVQSSNRHLEKEKLDASQTTLTTHHPSAPALNLTLPMGGRISNKKRRKKMKLLKKAAAAAKAAAALSSDIPQSANTTSIWSPSKYKKPSKVIPTTRCQNKRVANVAVACATETLASYKAELMASSKKVH